MPDCKGQIVCSVCVAHYNDTAVLAECLDALLKQTADFTIEIIVHDDASTDDSVSFIRTNFPMVKIIPSSFNVGYCLANNRMASIARGRFLLLLNNDATLLPDALATLLHEAESLDLPAILTLPQYAASDGRLLDRGSLLDPFYNNIPNLDPSRLEVAMVAGACLWLPASLWRNLGGFPPWFGNLAEDLLICCRARLAGYPVRVAAGSGYRHRVGHTLGGGKSAPGRLNSTFRRRALSERNKTFVMMLCDPLPLLLIRLPLHLVLLLLEGGILAMLKVDRRWLTHIYWPVLPALWRHRIQLSCMRGSIQQHRVTGIVRYLSKFRCWPRKLVLLMRHGLPRLS